MMPIYLGMETTPSAGSAKANSLDAVVDVALLLRAAVEGVGCPHQVAASEIGYGADYWCRVLANDRGIVLDRLGRLPRDVQVGFVTGWAEALGLSLERRGTGSPELAQLAELLASRRVRVTLERI